MGAKVHLPALTAEQYNFLIEVVKEFDQEAALVLKSSTSTYIEKSTARKMRESVKELLDTIG